MRAETEAAIAAAKIAQGITDSPHKGEVHPDGDEILYVVSGRLRVTGESDPTAAIEVGAGEACIVWKSGIG